MKITVSYSEWDGYFMNKATAHVFTENILENAQFNDIVDTSLGSFRKCYIFE